MESIVLSMNVKWANFNDWETKMRNLGAELAYALSCLTKKKDRYFNICIWIV